MLFGYYGDVKSYVLLWVPGGDLCITTRHSGESRNPGWPGQGVLARCVFQASVWGRPRGGYGVRPAKAGRTGSVFRIIAASFWLACEWGCTVVNIPGPPTSPDRRPSGRRLGVAPPGVA